MQGYKTDKMTKIIIYALGRLTLCGCPHLWVSTYNYLPEQTICLFAEWLGIKREDVCGVTEIVEITYLETVVLKMWTCASGSSNTWGFFRNANSLAPPQT